MPPAGLVASGQLQWGRWSEAARWAWSPSILTPCCAACSRRCSTACPASAWCAGAGPHSRCAGHAWRVLANPVTRCCHLCAASARGVVRCGACTVQAPALDACHAAVDYAYPWAAVLARFKFGQQPGLAAPAGDSCCSACSPAAQRAERRHAGAAAHAAAGRLARTLASTNRCCWHRRCCVHHASGWTPTCCCARCTGCRKAH